MDEVDRFGEDTASLEPTMQICSNGPSTMWRRSSGSTRGCWTVEFAAGSTPCLNAVPPRRPGRRAASRATPGIEVAGAYLTASECQPALRRQPRRPSPWRQSSCVRERGAYRRLATRPWLCGLHRQRLSCRRVFERHRV